ncbi:UNVERIFIED_CONTAM: hypothetical protein HDU68_012351 [Siphonaria sp. JEL0065]|nr:hypothetical protein HDU68_012351 [Siphonaria sp. JEL0065]
MQLFLLSLATIAHLVPLSIAAPAPIAIPNTNCIGSFTCQVQQSPKNNTIQISTINANIQTGKQDQWYLNDNGRFYALQSDDLDVIVNIAKPGSSGKLIVDGITVTCKKGPNANTTWTAGNSVMNLGLYLPTNKKVQCGGMEFQSTAEPSGVGIRIGGLYHPNRSNGGLCYSPVAKCPLQDPKIVIETVPAIIPGAKYCKKTTFSCKIESDPFVFPSAINNKNQQASVFSFNYPGLYHAVLAVDFQASVNITQTRDVVRNKDAFVVNEVHFRCGFNKTFSTFTFDTSNATQTLSCNPQTGFISYGSVVAGNQYSVTTMLAHDPVDHIQVQSIYYSGYYGLGGLCLNYDSAANAQGFQTSCPWQYGHNADSSELGCWKDNSCDFTNVLKWKASH